MDPLKRIQMEKEKLLKEMNPAPAEPAVQAADSNPAPATTPDPVVTPEPPAEPAKEPATEPVTPATPVQDQTDYKAEADRWKAKWESEVPLLHSRLKEQNEKLTAMKEQIDKLAATPAPQAAPELDEDGKPVYRSPHVSDELRKTENYQWHVEQIGKTATERHFESLVLTGQQTIKPVQEQIGQVKSETEEDRFNRELHGIAPAWTGLQSGINVDAGFCEWVEKTPAPGTGGTFKALLGQAYQSANLKGMAEIINLYESLKQVPATPAPVTPEIPKELVAPPRTGGGQQTVIDNNQGKVLSMADMNKLYEDYRLGRYTGKEAEYQRKKEEFMKAKAEGRLI